MMDTLFEEYIPTDKWSLTDWYLSKVVYLDRLYARLCRASLSGGDDRRAMIDFVSAVRAYFVNARYNFQKHLSDTQFVEFEAKVNPSSRELSYELCDELMTYIRDFHWRSGITKLSETRALGSFAKARSNLGLEHKKGENSG